MTEVTLCHYFLKTNKFMEIKIPYYEDIGRISRGYLETFAKSPKELKKILDGKSEFITTPAMENGTMVHMYLLQEKEFKETYKILNFETPSSAQQKQFALKYIESKAEKPILKASEAFSTCYATDKLSEEKIAEKGLEMALKLKSYIKHLREKGNNQKQLTFSKLNTLKAIKESVQMHKQANELLYKLGSTEGETSFNEFHINWEFPVDKDKVIDCKSLLDRFVIDENKKILYLIDIKTTVSLSGFSKSFKEYNYGFQMCFYWAAIYWYMKNVLGKDPEDYSHETKIIAIENGTNECRVFTVPDSLITNEIQKISSLLKGIYWHITNDKWDYTREYYEGDGSESLLYDI